MHPSRVRRSDGVGQTRRLPIHSQASFPCSVALAQLPSPSACSLEVVIWYTDLLEIPISHRGLVQCGRHPNNSMPMTGVPKKCTGVAGREFSDGQVSRRNPVISVVIPLEASLDCSNTHAVRSVCR
jgi:hypothetical protein